MVEGRESVLYALPFCAGTVTGIFLCGHHILYSGDSYQVASVSMLAGSCLAAAAVLAGDRIRHGSRLALAVAAVFFCGMFCWSSHEITDIAAEDRGSPNIVERATEPAAAWLKSGIDALRMAEIRDRRTSSG